MCNIIDAAQIPKVQCNQACDITEHFQQALLRYTEVLYSYKISKNVFFFSKLIVKS